MTDNATVQPATPVKPMGLAARFVGVITSPRATFAAVAAAPRWLGMALVVILITLACQMWFQSTAVGKQAMLDDSVRRMESFGMKVSDQTYEAMRQGFFEPSPARLVGTAAAMVVFPPIMWAVLAGVLFLIFGVFTAGEATYRQVYAAVVHSGAVGVVQVLFTTPLNYLRETTSSATNLGVFLPFLPEGNFLARFAGMVDVFLVWWVIVLSIGVAVTYKKKTGGVAAVLFGVYAVIAIAIAAFQAARS